MGTKKVVITGASGFLGRRLLNNLKGREYSVFALTSRPEELEKTIDFPGIKCLNKDIVFNSKESGFLSDAIIVNCAYPRNLSGESVADGLRYIKAVFEAAAYNHAGSVINISSQSVYSPQRREPATEETPLCLDTKYAIGKFATELMLESICGKENIRYTNIRMASLIGPGFDQRIVNRFVRQALDHKEIKVNRNSQQFGFFDIEDAANGIIAMIDSGSEQHWDSVYNLGNNKTYSLVEIAETVKQVLHGTTDISIVLTDDDSYSNSAIDSNKFMSDFGFSPKIDIYKSVEIIANSIRYEFFQIFFWDEIYSIAGKDPYSCLIQLR